MAAVLPRATHFRRFLYFLRQEGWHSAIQRARIWWQVNSRGNARSIAPDVTGTSGGTSSDAISFWEELSSHSAFHVSSPKVLRQKRKVALIGDLNLPQCRKYRVEQLVEIFAEAGAEFVYSHYEDLPRATDIMQDASHLVLYRLRTHPAVTQHIYEARRLGLPILYDIDDPLFSLPAYATYGNMKALPADMKQHFMREAPFYADIMNLADAVSVSTPALQEHARKFTPRPVFLRRNFADRATLSAAEQADESPHRGFRVCFASGSHGHEQDFALIADDLGRFLHKDPERKLVIIGHFDKTKLPPAMRDRVEWRPFSGYADYLRDLGSCDAAVMPLVDDLFNRCKSSVRVIDASSVSVPSIVGRVSDMAAMVREGETGHVVERDGRWDEPLEMMARNRSRTRFMGQAARRDLETVWSARLSPPIVDSEMVRWIMA